jgi:hypothetical protein
MLYRIIDESQGWSWRPILPRYDITMHSVSLCVWCRPLRLHVDRYIAQLTGGPMLMFMLRHNGFEILPAWI